MILNEKDIETLKENGTMKGIPRRFLRRRIR